MRRVILRGRDANVLKDASLGLAYWNDRVKEFGFGTNLGGHIPGTRKGNIPNSSLYDNIYGKNHWGYRTIYSISIGEGELLTTPLQMANLAAIIANKGYFIEPHTVRDIGGLGKPNGIDSLHKINVLPKYFEPVVDAMQNVIEDPNGTGNRARIDRITICGKTGTVQNKDKKDHSVFMAFAPRDNPKIALSVYVEYAGAGGEWAAPIASLLVEKYLTDSVSNIRREERILNFHP
jgi:penicillin-binding protein 2